MTISPADWAYLAAPTRGGAKKIYCSFPLLEACPKWTASSDQVRHKVKHRFHLDDNGMDITLYFSGLDETLTTSRAEGADEWSSSWADATETNNYPEGITHPALPDDNGERLGRVNMQGVQFFSTFGAYINGIQIGQYYDEDYVSPGLDVELADRLLGNRLDQTNWFASSYLITEIICHTINKIIHEATWKICAPCLRHHTTP